AITSSGTILAGIYDNNIGLSGKYGIMKLDSFTGTWQRVSVSVEAPFNQTYSDQNLRIESVFNINIIDEQIVASIGGSYINFGYAFSITKPVHDIDNATSAWQVKWVQDSLPGSGSFYEHLTNLFKDSHDTIWASVSSSGNEINNNLYTGSLSAAEPWTLTMDSIAAQTGRFLFAEAAHGRLYSLSYFTGNQIFVRANSTNPVSVNEVAVKPANSWQLFPNPASSYVRLSNSINSTPQNLRLTMYDALGNTVLQQHINQQNEFIPLSEKLPAGLYVLSIGNEKEQQILRLVKTE
ncbi:MAG TPA: T9SS type A sorting domain-containing protein, partial [Chitinophagales bacterium]|nr:T9SS type A sorting domain-containing protein [Chitinophagales bacterium]